MRKVAIWLPIIFSIAAWNWFPLAVWISINQGLIAFLGLLAAALIQVISVTAAFLQSDDLFPDEAVRLSKEMEKQQRYWLGLLTLTLVTFVLVLIVSAMPIGASFSIQIEAIGARIVELDRLASALLAMTLAFLMIKMTGVLFGVLSLQRLRSELTVLGAKRRSAERVDREIKAVDLPQNVVPSDYGKIVRPH